MKYIPSILINGKVFWGNWSEDNLLEAICSSLLNKPNICFTYGGLSGVKNTSSKFDHSSYFIIYIIIIVCFVISLMIFLYCKHKIQQNIYNNLDSSNFGHKINTVVTTYLALKDPKQNNRLETVGSSSIMEV